MTKQDFELIARVIAELPIANEFGKPKVEFWAIVRGFGNALNLEHPRFDHDKFERACCGDALVKKVFRTM